MSVPSQIQFTSGATRLFRIQTVSAAHVAIANQLRAQLVAAGIPASLDAFKTAREVFKERGV